MSGRYGSARYGHVQQPRPGEWPDLFGDPLLASAGLDRLAHHAETLIITGRSYRAQGQAQGSDDGSGSVSR